MPRITIRLSDKLLAALEARAKEEHRSVSNLACRILGKDLGVKTQEKLSKKQNPELPLT